MPATFVIFGASGDLTSRKLIPALYSLYQKKRLREGLRVVGFSRSPFSHERWRQELAATTARFVGEEFDRALWGEFAQNVYYQPGDIGEAGSFDDLRKFLSQVESGPAPRVYYLATAPKFYEPAVEQLARAGLTDERQAPRRVVVEKPFGYDLVSARRLNQAIHHAFDEQQVYRIDHYLGKETVQNLFVLRFANAIFDPIWNRNYIDHVQITVAEEVGVGKRAGYYDSAGVMRDMFQNHLLQLLMITAMEPPVRWAADSIRNEKVKVLHALRALSPADVATDTLRGQYEGYAQAEGVAPGSHTATFAAARLQVDNWRWQGVPFYLRSGKEMSCRTTQIVIQFREPPHKLFNGAARNLCEANRLVVQVQPAEGIQLHFQTKVPDAGMKLRETDLSFNYRSEYGRPVPGAYERLLLDALEGDASLFARADEVEAAWKVCDPIIAAWQEGKTPPLLRYEPGNWGPEASAAWMRSQGREWFDSCPVLS
ncbi:MAG: glucose-6-phosphate dehydrogenase [Pirellulales bacterium]|nr:glucose-6-phosphate dehydrogenase [Pirellulales bacterium]